MHRRDVLLRASVDALQQEGYALVDRLGDAQTRRLVFRGKPVEGAGQQRGLVDAGVGQRLEGTLTISPFSWSSISPPPPEPCNRATVFGG